MATLLHFSDLHICPDDRRVYRTIDTAAHLANVVAAAMMERDRLGPVDAIVVTGDLTQLGRPEEYLRAAALLAPLVAAFAPAPLLALPGNHDRRAAFRVAFPDGRAGDAPIFLQRRIGPLRFLGLDSLQEGRPDGALDAEDAALAAEEVARAAIGGAPVVVALHHPPTRTGLPAIDDRPLTGAAALTRALVAHGGVRLTLAGHAHRRLSLKRRIGAVEIAPPTFPAPRRGPGAWTPGDGVAPMGFLRHEITATGVQTRFVEVTP